MRTIFRYLTYSVLGCLMAAACSVKEDREPCPSYLNVSFRDRASITGSVSLLGYNTSEVFRKSLLMSDYEGDYWIKAVHKSRFNLSAFYGGGNVETGGHYVTIPLGSECDSLYAFQTDVDCTAETAYAEVVFHKQFCTVTVDLHKPLDGWNGISHYSFLVEGNTCGFDLTSYRPVEGRYRIEPLPLPGEKVARFRVPRQADNSLKMTVYYTADGGEFINMGVFPIGTYMARMGYEWLKVDLEDIFIDIDLIAGYATVTVEGWEDGMTFSFIEQ